MAFMYVLELLRNFCGGALAFIHPNILAPGTFQVVCVQTNHWECTREKD